MMPPHGHVTPLPLGWRPGRGGPGALGRLNVYTTGTKSACQWRNARRPAAHRGLVGETPHDSHGASGPLAVPVAGASRDSARTAGGGTAQAALALQITAEGQSQANLPEQGVPGPPKTPPLRLAP
jgi:hypothetical protein